MSRVRRLIALLLTTGLAVAGCARPGTAPAARAAAPGPVVSTVDPEPTCGPDGVMVTEGRREGAMGLRLTRIDLLNCGTEPYTVQGRPTLRLFDDDGDRLDVTVLADIGEITASLAHFDGPPRRVTAAPGQRLVAAVVWRNLTDSFDPTATAASLEVTPAPNQPGHRVVLEPVIDLGNTGRLAVTAWREAPPLPPESPGAERTPRPVPTPDPLL